MRLSVLGGSSPFTADFFTALAAQPVPALRAITLYGRDRTVMADLCTLGATLCPAIAFDWTDDVDRACTGYDVIVCQIRFGGLAGRGDDEDHAIAMGAPPDESIGPAGLHRALAMKDELMALGARIAAGSPGAHLVNLTNPLGLATSMLHQAGIAQPIGICELPAYTAQQIADLLGCPPEALDWSYSGLNHRGFLHHLRVDGEDALPRLAGLPDAPGFGGLDAAAMLAFGAVPTKYFSLFSQRAPVSPRGRAAILATLRAQVAAELHADPRRVPPSLARRPQPWWAQAVVPLLDALAAPEPRILVLNLPDADGLTREMPCRVAAGAVRPVEVPAPPAPVQAWIDRFAAHERACLAALADPGPEAIAAANRLDPLLAPASAPADAMAAPS